VNLKQGILWPLTLPYRAVTYLRAAAYESGALRPKRLDGVVISVGNLTVGGTGKTPMVAAIAEHLVTEGKRVAILTRGYRGEQPDKRSSGASSGRGGTSDEVRLLDARLGARVEFGVGADRFARGRELETRGVEWFVLDDGFQHRQLARDVDIVLIDATNPFGGGHLLPAGRLREPRSALKRADIVVITRSDRAMAVEAAVRHYTEAPIFYAQAKLDYVREIGGERRSESNAGPDTESGTPSSGGPAGVPNAIAVEMERWFAFCGIGNPAAFIADLRAWKFPIVGHKFFRDHHRYTQTDAQSIEREAEVAGASRIVCTEKDIFNFSGVRWGAATSPYFCGISMGIDREVEFWAALEAQVIRKRTTR
jgi:tetraacyldisaccharide 4'-kinase